jgi:transcriptional regulator with XRE-family HTH domain
MPKALRRSAKRSRSRKSQRLTPAELTRPPSDLASRLRGLYGRVARKLGVDPSYVSRVARGERRSRSVDHALRRELNKIILSAGRQEFARRKAERKKKPHRG